MANVLLHRKAIFPTNEKTVKVIQQSQYPDPSMQIKGAFFFHPVWICLCARRFCVLSSTQKQTELLRN